MNNDILLNRKIMSWGWYKDANTMRIFLHLLLNANWHDGEYRGKPILRGQCVFGLQKLSADLGVSFQQSRTALEHLKSTGEITIKVTNKYSIATIVKYSDYQLSSDYNNSQNNTQDNTPSTNKQQTTNNIQLSNSSNSVIQDNNPLPPKGESEPSTINQFIKSLPYSESFKSAFHDFAEMRRTIKHPMTVRAAQMIVTDLNKLSDTEQGKIDILNQSIKKSWQGVFEVKEQGQQKKSTEPDYSKSIDFFGE